MSGRDGKLETILHRPAAHLALRSVQGWIRSRVRRRNQRYHVHPGLVRYLQLSIMNFLLNVHLVTKPFNSTAGLSKPFRPPTFVRPQVGLVQLAPIPAAAASPNITAATREPSIDLELPDPSDEDMEETENRERKSMQLNTLNWLTTIFRLARNRSTGCRYSLAA